MERIKKAVQTEIEGIEPTIVELLSTREVQLYIAILNALVSARNDFLEQLKNNKVNEETRRRFVTLKKVKISLENKPMVKTYLAVLDKHAMLARSYQEIESLTDYSHKR